MGLVKGGGGGRGRNIGVVVGVGVGVEQPSWAKEKVGRKVGKVGLHVNNLYVRS